MRLKPADRKIIGRIGWFPEMSDFVEVKRSN